MLFKNPIAGRSSVPCPPLTAVSEAERPLIPPPPVPPDPTPPKRIEPPNEEPTNLTKPIFEPTFLPPKSISHSKISPSSIPNPSPSVSTTKQLEPSYPNYSSYLYSIPGYSAFQPLSYPGMLPSHTPVPTSEPSKPDFVPFPSIPKETTENKTPEVKTTEIQAPKDVPKPQTDFEEQFTPEIIPAVTSVQDVNKNVNESKMSITSLAQGSGATVTIPTQICNKDVNKKKVPERFSLKTSIPISKIDIKCVGNPPEPILTNTVAKPPASFNPAFSSKPETVSKVEIQSNIVIKGPVKDTELSEPKPAPKPCQTSIKNINSLISAAEAVNKIDSQFRKPEPKSDIINEVKEPPPNFPPQSTNIIRPVISPMNIETSKASFTPKAPEGNFNEQKNQILFIQNKNQNPKMLLTIQQQNPQVLLQRTNFESKNVQVPSRLSSQSKKEEISENGTSSKVVALKRLHQENCDENDFENLITENQIYGNKIVVKEKSQRTLLEQELKNKKVEKQTQETKNVVLQPNFLYLSNVQFPANLMMIKNNSKTSQPSDTSKFNKAASNENKVTSEAGTMTNPNELNTKNNKLPSIAVSKEIHVLKSNNNVLQTLSNKNSKTDIVFQPHQKVIRNPQILYQVPMIVDSENKLNQPFINREYQKFTGQNNKEYTKLDGNDKLFIACPYQMDSKLQPKIVITNIRPKVNKVDEVSSLDIYEKRKRLRRLKYLSNRDTKDSPKVDNIRKNPEKNDSQRNLITPDKINKEICKELTNTKVRVDEGSSESESDYDEDALKEYEAIIKEYSPKTLEDNKEKADFLCNFGLGTHEACREKDLNRQERIIQRDLVASAYISAGRIDRIMNEDGALDVHPENPKEDVKQYPRSPEDMDNGKTFQKQLFLTQLKLSPVSQQNKAGYERIWLEILKERKRRNGDTTEMKSKQCKTENKNIELDPNCQLQILTEIKKSVNENNNLIKKKLDSNEAETNTGDSIHTLAEKNFSELNRLSTMADMSVKLITGQDAKKRDLNPGFDSENIQKPILKQPCQNYPQINIPDIAKIISLKSQETTTTSQVQPTTQATSMDEPVNSAAGADPQESQGTKEFGCQVEEALPWPGIEAVMKSYRDYETARRKEINEYHRRNTALRVEGAHITRMASRESDRARALLAERRLLANEEAAAKRTLQAIMAAVDVIKKYE
ncbi:hypothetical protein O0L34_g10206 [Tuta absoluta]|nr:hypothetical protein O0L34_g10206 [Tuta absoluta]